MIQVGQTGIWFDGGNKGHFDIYVAPIMRIIRNYHKDSIMKLSGYNVDCSGEIFKAILKYVDFYSPELGKRFLKNHEWLIIECIRKQIDGHKHMGKCYNCGVDPKAPPILVDEEDGEEYVCCPPMDVDPDWELSWIPLNYNLQSDKFVEVINAPVTFIKDFDLRSEYIYGVHLICKIKSIKNSIVEHGNYYQKCVFCDDDTSKTIKAELQNNVADFDKWNKNDKVEVYGVYNENRLAVTSMKLIEEKESEPFTINRNDETPGYNDWRKKIISRDAACVCCGHDKHLEAHHLFGYKENPSLAVNENNGVTLCKFCHDKYHSVYGVKDINPVDFMNFIKRFGVR